MRASMHRFAGGLIAMLLFVFPLLAGVSKEIENEYRQRFENKAMFLKIPVRGERQVLYLRGGVLVTDQSSLGQPVVFKVGEQVRIMKLSFKDSMIEYELSSTDMLKQARIVYDFGRSLPFSFPDRPAFDSGLRDTFTEGLTYQELDAAKQGFVKDQFNRQVRQYSDITGLSTSDVLKAMLSESPEYEKVRSDLSATREELNVLQGQLDRERTEKKSLEVDASSMRVDLGELNRANEALRTERDQLAQDLATLKSELASVKEANTRIERQVQEASERLSLESGAKQELGDKVDSLSASISALTRDRENLSKKVETLTNSLEETEERSAKVEQDLRLSQRKASKLESNLKALTSNRNSLEANYVRTKEVADNLEQAKLLEQAISVKPVREDGGEGEIYRADLYVLTQKLGTLEANFPPSGDQPIKASFTVDSPDTVQFTEDERQFFDALGSEMTLDLSWQSWSGKLEATLQGGDSQQSIAPRESGDWTWKLDGEPVPGDGLTLVVRLINGAKVPVHVTSQDFELTNGGLFAGLYSAFSLLSLLIGLALGLVVTGVFVSIRHRSSVRPRESVRNRRYSTEKSL